MERLEILSDANMGLAETDSEKSMKMRVKKETIDMRSLINRFKERDFKLWRCIEAFERGWSFSSVNYTCINGKEIL